MIKYCLIFVSVLYLYPPLSLSCTKESYFKAMANAPIVILDDENEQDIDYDSDGNPIIPESAKVCFHLMPKLL